MKREPVVAGQFYPASSSELSMQVSSYTEDIADKKSAIGIVSPHAGLMYSGKVAGAVFSRIRVPETIILIGPNHTGLGSPVSIMSSGEWQVPTGQLSIDEDIALKLKAHSSIFEENSKAHEKEHSLEVQLPFVLHFGPSVKIVPISVMNGPLEKCRIIGRALADVIEDSGHPVTIVASSDMSHYVSDAIAKEKDSKAIERILALDPEELYNTVVQENISMCGVMPVTSMLFAAGKLGAKKAELVKYMTSGEISGDYDYVVSYAGLVIS